MSKLNIGEIEVVDAGVSTSGKARFKGESTLADGSKVYVTVYRVVEGQGAPKREAKSVKPTVRKSEGTVAAVPAAPTANPAALALGLSDDQLAKLAKVLASMKG